MENQWNADNRKGMTFGALCNALGKEGSRTKKLPTAKALLEQGRMLWSENVNGRTLTMYDGGFFTYSGDRHITVGSVWACQRAITYVFADGTESRIEPEDFVHLPYQFRLSMEGEARLDRNADERERWHCLSYDEFEEAESSDLRDVGGSAEDELIQICSRQEMHGCLISAMATLTDRQRAVVEAVIIHKKTQQQAANELGCSRQSINECLAAALKKMEKHIKGCSQAQ